MEYQIVEVNGEELEFPADMTDDQIVAAIRGASPTPEAPPVAQPGFLDAMKQGNVPAMAEKLPFLTGVGRGVDEMRRNLPENMARVPGNPAAFGLPGLLASQEPPQAPENAPEQWEGFKVRHPYSAEGGRIGARVAPAFVPGAGAPMQVAGGLVPALTDENPLFAGGLSTGSTLAMRGLLGGGKQLYNAYKGRFPVRSFDEIVDPIGLLGKAQDRGYRFPHLNKAGRGIQTSALDEAAAKHPWTRKILDTMQDANQGQFQDDIGAALGTKASRFDDGSMDIIAQELSDKYKVIADQIDNVSIPAGFADDFKKVATSMEYARFSDELSSGTISGKTLQKIRTIASKATTSPQKLDEAMGVVNELDNLVGKKVPKTLSGEYKAAREQWRNFFQLRKLNSADVRSPLTGEVAAKSLHTRLRSAYKGRPPSQKATQGLLDSSGAMAGVKSWQHSPGTAETLTMTDLIRQIVTSGPAMLGAARLGQAAPTAANVGGLLGRGALLPELIQPKEYPGLL